MMKENDYILANILNPGFSNQDFKDILGMNMENTQILPYSSYTSSPFITSNEQFQDNNGNFSEQKFKDFYTANVGKFSTFNVNQPVVENFEYSIFDSSRKSNSRVKDPNFRFSIVSNPDRITTGIAGRNQRENSTLSRSEMAQQSKIWDSEKKKWLDYSPNDISLVKNPVGWFKSLFDDPLVKATWDEDGDHIDPITKKKTHHYKGDLRLNDLGQYFYETLGGRSTIGKEVLSSFDILTVDGEGINKYDFLDSDGLDKSVTGTIAKTALTVAPLFMGAPVAATYSGALIARELGKSLPMLYGMVSSLWGNTEDSKALNTVAAYADKFSSGTSDYSRENTFTFENIASLIGDVATQWGQQRTIAESISKLRGSNKIMEDAYRKAAAYYELEARSIRQGAISALHRGEMKGLSPLQYIGNPEKWQESALGAAAIKKFVKPAEKLAKSNMRLGADASLAYMAIVSNTDVYASMLEHGASKRDAAAIAFGSTLGMFAVDRYLGLGELFFDELRNDARLAMRGAFRREADAVASSLIGAEAIIRNPEVRQNALKRLITRGINFSKGITEKFASDVKNHSTGFLGKAIGEGLEEVSEELVTDLSKQLYELAGEFSPNFINQSGITDVGAWENAKERYLMSLLGGTLGGGLFYGVDVYQRGSFKRDTSKDELIYLVANNRTQEALKELDKWKAAGKFGSKTLSASKYEYDSEGNPVFLTAETEDDSQNTFIYNRIRESILQLENILNQTGTNLSEDDLFKQMVLSEQRFLDMKDFLQDQSYTTKYQQLFRTITRELIDAERALSTANRTVDGTANGEFLPDAASAEIVNNPVRLENIEKLRQKVEELRALRDSFLKGEQSLPYTEKMLFAIDKFLNSAFSSMTYDTWLKANKGKTIDLLSDSEKQVFKEEYLEYKKNKQSLDLDQSFDLYKQIKKVVDPYIAKLAENASSFETNSEVLSKLFSEDGPLGKFVQVSYEEQLEGESEEDYNNRNTQLEGESDKDYKARRDKRKQDATAQNLRAIEALQQEIVQLIDLAGGYIDPSTQRYIHNSFEIRRDDVASDIIRTFIANRQAGLLAGTTMRVLELMKKLKPDLSNYDEVKAEMIEMVQSPHRKNIEERNRGLIPVMNGITRMFQDFGYQYDPNTVTGATVLDFMNQLVSRIQAGDPEVEAKFTEMDRVDYLLKLLDSEDMLGELMFYDYSKDGLIEYYLGEDGEGVRGEEWAPIVTNILDGQLNYDMHIYSLEEINDMVEEMSAQSVDYVEQTLTLISDNVTNDPFIKMMDEVDAKVTSTNPITQLLKLIHVAIDPQNRSVEDLLDALHRKSLGIDSLDNFKLSEDEELAIRDAEQLLETVKAYLYAAGTDTSFAFPVGHNKVLNEFAKNHKGVYPNFEELPTLDQSVADMYMVEIDKYLMELSEDAATSWIALSNRNKINKRKKLITAEGKFNDAKLEVLNVLNKSDSVKFIVNGKSYDLLEGMDAITDENPAVRLHKIENLFFINLHKKAMADGLSFKEILKASHVLESLPGIGDITSLVTAELDDTIEYGKLTKFDTFVYLLTISGISSNEFLNFIKERVEESQQAELDKKIVPLTIQEQTSRIALAQIKSKEIFSQALEYLKESTLDDRAILDYFVFVDGSAGVGKTLVIARNASKFINSDKIWLSAPKDTQLRTLKEVIGKGTTKSRTDLFNLIMDPDTYQKLLKLMKGSEGNTDLFNTKDLPGENTAQILNLEAIKFNEIEDLPELIIIDEVTHFSGLEMLILNAFAKKNNISILALGDTNQNGFKGLSRNIDREKIISVRSPKLSISLRDVNLQKQENLLNVLHIVNSMLKLDSTDPLYDEKFRNLTRLIRQINFRVYNLEELNGDLITGTLTSEQVGKMFGTVAFVGKTDGDAYQKLKEHGDNIKEVITLQPDEVQGQEFDFIVVDLNWNLDTSKDIRVLNFLTDLYTLMSRGRIGSIFIDNNLSDIIGSNKDSLSKEDAPNLKEAIQPFIDAKLEVINSLELVPNEEFNGTSEPQQLPPTSTGLGYIADIKSLISSGTILDKWGNFLGREVIVANVNGVMVPFYRSSQGTDGKVKGKWYPFFGFGSGSRSVDTSELSWLIKGDITDMENGYGIPALKVVQDALNSQLTYDENSFNGTTHPYFTTAGMGIFGTMEDFNILVLRKANPGVKNGVNAQAHIDLFLLRIKEGKAPEPEVLSEDETLQVEEAIESSEEAEQDRKDMEEALGDKTPEIIQKTMEKIELDSDFPIRIYGSAHIANLVRTKKLVDGKETIVYVNPRSEIKSDLQIFMKGDEADGDTMNQLVSNLLNLKSVILYGDDPRSLHPSVSEVVDAEHLANIKYKIEVRPYSEDTDHFVGFTGLQENGEGGNSISLNGLVYTIVGEFKNNAGETCKVTLGLLANPDSFFVSRQVEAKGQEQVRAVKSRIDRYKKLFDNITKKYELDGKFYQDVTPSFSGLTNIRRYTGVGNARKAVPEMTLDNFRKTHPYTVISDPYIYTGKNFKGLKSDKLRGHAVVFVSNDTTLKPEELMNIYIQQKEATASIPDADLFNLAIKPRVRMLMLDTVGVSFKSLTFTKKMKELYSTEQIIGGKKAIKMFPFEEDYMGARMFTALWNYRANLKKFLNAYLNFNWTLLDGTKLSDDDIVRIARYADAVHKKNSSNESSLEDNVQDILSNSTATEEEIKLLTKFNDSLATEVRQFRIGGSRKKSGVYLRNLTNISEDNVFYKGLDETPVGIYITPEVANKQYKLINSLINDSFGSVVQLKDGDGNAWPETRTVSSKEGYSNSLSGLITKAFAGGTIDVTEDGVDYKLQLPNHKTFVYIPILLLKIYTGARKIQNDPEADYENISIGEKSGNPQLVSYREIVKLLNPSVGDDFDSSLDDLLALAFHGTTSDPSRFVKVPSGEGHGLTNPNSSMRATDAYFKDGFYVDPMGAEVVGESSIGAGLFKRCLTNESLFIVNVDVDMPIFTVTLTDLLQAYDDSTKPPVEQTEIVPQELRDRYSNPDLVPPAILNDIEDLFSTVKSTEEFLQKATALITEHYQKQVVPKAFKNRIKPSEILNGVWSQGLNPESTISVRSHLESLSGKSLEGAKLDWDGENISVSLPDGITFLTVSFDKHSGFTVTTTIANTDTAAGEGATKLQVAQDMIRRYLSNPLNSLKLEDFRSEYEVVYDELVLNIDSYATIDDLITALKGMQEPTDYDDVILEIIEEVASVKEGLIC